MASRTLQSTIEISGVLSPSLQAAIKNAVGKLDEMSKETLEAVGAAEKLSAEISTQESVLKSLQKGYADYIVSGKGSSEEAQALSEKIQELSFDLNKNKRVLREAGEEAEEAGQKAGDSGEGYTVLKGAISDLVSDAISKAVEAFKELMTEGDNALSMLEAKTGATGEELADFKDVMYEVYNANYGESLGDVQETLSTVLQMTDDLDNASLAKVTKSAIALEDVFGYDTAESMRAVNSLMDQFGITSDEAFNLIVQGAQKGLDQNGDLLDTINEYSVQFKGAGYTADDMFNMLLNGAETGTWSVDKLGDAVKEFNIRMSDGTASEYLEDLGVDAEAVMEQFNKGGPEAQKAIGSVMKAIMDCDDATLQYQTGVGIFGTMWEDLGAETVAALMETEGAISSTNNAMAQMDAAAYDTLSASVSSLGRTIKAEVLQPIAEGVTPALKGVVDFATNNLPTVGVIIGGVAAAVTAFKVAAWSAKLATEGFTIATKLQSVAQTALNAVMNANPIGLIILAITALVAAFVYLWNNCEGFRNFWIGLWDGIKSAAGSTVEWLKGAWAGVSSFFTNSWASIKSIATSVWTGIKNAITSPITSAWNLVSGVIEKLKNAFNFKWSLPKLKLPHISVSGGKAPYGIAGKGKLPSFSIEWYKDGGIMTSPTVFGINPATGSLMAGGEAGAEAVLPLSVLWDKLELVLRRILNSQSSTGGTPDEGLTSKAGELLTLDNFSLGSLSDGTSVVIYYDFSGFTWSPQIHMGGTGDDEDTDDFMARLKAHEAEFFDWLEEFIQMREAAQYA